MFIVHLFFILLFFPLNLYALSFKELKLQLKDKPPMNVGFDVDDTVLFSSPAFYFAINTYCKSNNLQSHSYLLDNKCNMDSFWLSVNTIGVGYSMPKAIAYKLINLHKERKDDIWFITKRNSSKDEYLTKTLAKLFNIANINKVIFTNSLDKAPFIKEKGVELYYGDADSDIESAKSAGARPIRIKRAPNSDYKLSYNLKKYGEDVLDNSAF